MTAAEALFALGQGETALPALIALLTHENRIIRNETLLALCRIGEPARGALPHLDKPMRPSRHTGIWSYDNIPAMVRLARACLSGPAAQDSAPVSGPSATATLRQTREKYLP